MNCETIALQFFLNRYSFNFARALPYLLSQSGMGESEFWLGLASHFVEDSDSTWTREFCDVDPTVWLESFIQKSLFVLIKKIIICKVKFSLISITVILIEYIVLEGVFSSFSTHTFRRSWMITCASYCYWICFLLFHFISVHFWSVYQYNI
jgi:hypothetical protein